MVDENKIEIELLKKEVQDMKEIHLRLDTAIVKLTDLSNSVYRMLSVHEEKLARQEDDIVSNEKEIKGITELINTLSTLNNETTSDDIQAIVFAVGKKLEYENLREWFKGLYETVLGQSEGPRMGSFIKLYGIESTIKLLEDVILGKLVKE